MLTLELGSAFKNQYGDANGVTFAQWCKELAEFSRDDLQRGFVNFINSRSTYMSLNIFRNHCKRQGEDYGIDCFDMAYAKTMRRAWEDLHPAFQHIIQEFDIVKNKTSGLSGKGQSATYLEIKNFDRVAKYSVSEMKNDPAKKMFTRFYNEVVRRVSNGEEFQRIVAIEDQGAKVNRNMKPYESGRKTMSGLLGLMGSAKARHG